MEPIQIKTLTAEKGPIVGIAMVAHHNITHDSPAVVSDGKDTLPIQLRFYQGDLNLVRSELHQIVDEAIDILLDN